MLLHSSRTAVAASRPVQPAPTCNAALHMLSSNFIARQARRPRQQSSVLEFNFSGYTTSRGTHGYLQPGRQQHVCWSTIQTEPIPEDVQLELNPDISAKEVAYDEQTKTISIPLAAINDGQRRTKMVMFTCNQCGGRSARLVNPVAWERGAVFCQCQHCAVWHTLAAQPHIIEEVRYNDPDWRGPGATASNGQHSSEQSSDTILADNDEDQEVTSAPAGSNSAPQG